MRAWGAVSRASRAVSLSESVPSRVAIGGFCEALTRILDFRIEPTSRGFNSSSCTDPDGLVGGAWFGVVNARGCLVGWVGVEIVLSSWEGSFVFHVNAALSAYRLGVWGASASLRAFPAWLARLGRCPQLRTHRRPGRQRHRFRGIRTTHRRTSPCRGEPPRCRCAAAAVG